MQNGNTIAGKRAAGNESGSVLVGVIGLAIVMAVACLGYLQVSSSTANQEIIALRDTEALRSAEAGLLLGVRWVSQQAKMPTQSATDIFSNDPLVINGCKVAVDVVVAAAAFGAQSVSLRSTASNSGLTYDKQLDVNVEQSGPGRYGTFLLSFDPNAWRGGSGDPTVNNTVFDGPFHSNDPIAISALSGNVETRFLGPATIHHAETDMWGYGTGTHHRNNYDYGVKLYGHQDEAMQYLDQNVFDNSYRHHQDSITMDLPTTHDILLPPNDVAVYPDPNVPSKRATLKFEGASATYYYYQGGKLRTKPLNVIDGRIIYAENELNVLGKVDARTTVVTAAGCNIYPVGDLVYSDFSPASDGQYAGFDNSQNYGVGSNSGNVLGLISGDDVHFAPEWLNPETGARQMMKGSMDEYMYVTAMAVAMQYKSSSLRFKMKNQKQVLVQDYAFSNKGGIRMIGARSLSNWFQVPTGANVASRFYRMYYDQRFSDGLSPVGLEGGFKSWRDGSSRLKLVLSKWKETNI